MNIEKHVKGMEPSIMWLCLYELSIVSRYLETENRLVTTHGSEV